MKGLVDETLKIIDEMYYAGEIVNYYTVCEKADVSRRFLYDHEVIKKKIKYYKKFNKLSIDNRIAIVKSENKELREKLTKYEALLISSLEKQGSL